jgi:purine-nucleoside phosphorylase
MGSGQFGIKDYIKIKQVIKFSDIPGLAKTTIKGHLGEIVVGTYNDIEIICCLGRLHYYEGLSIDKVAIPVKILNALKIKNIIICNSSGCLNKNWKIGDVMYINSYIDYSFKESKEAKLSKIKSLNDNNKITIINKISRSLNIPIHYGAYTWVTGPSYETPAEIKEMQRIGAAAVGMSTLPEIKEAILYDMNIFGLSLLTNYASGISGEVLHHDDVIKNAMDNMNNFIKIIFKLIESIEGNINE